MSQEACIPCRYETAAPAQHDSLDCALFVLGYAIAKLRGSLMSFEQADMPVMRRQLTEQLLRLGKMRVRLVLASFIVFTMELMLWRVTGTTTTAEEYLSGDFRIMASIAAEAGNS